MSEAEKQLTADQEEKISQIWSGSGISETIKWKAPDTVSKCRWSGQSSEKSPHTHKAPPNTAQLRVAESAVDLIGVTPMVRLRNIERKTGVGCELWAKCEFMSVGGSVKDRIAKRMVEDAENHGRLNAGDVIIEPTSGNTGIGLALVAAVKGYRCIIVMPEKMSDEKVNILRALGAEIVRTPTSARYDSPESHISVAQQLNLSVPNSIILDQYTNPSNPLAHYDDTAEEILFQMDGRMDALVLSPGTGGTMTGLARKLKEKLPHMRVVGADPVGSVLAPAAMNGCDSSYYDVEGIGYDFIPTVLDQSVVDKWYKSVDKDSFECGRMLMRCEGLLVGGSSGTILWAALQECKVLPKGSRVVIVLPDSIRNYMTKYLSDDWMIEKGFLDDPRDKVEAWWRAKTVAGLKLKTPCTVPPSAECKTAINIMNGQSVDQMPIVDANGLIVGVVTLGSIMAGLIAGKVQDTSPVSQVLYKSFHRVTLDCRLGKLSRILDMNSYALVVHRQIQYNSEHEVETKEMIFAIATRMDLMTYITHGPSSGA
jgi:cystathionine beta-synthase